MREKYHPSGHVDIGDSLNNIGLCYENQNEQKMALDHFQRALTYYEKLLPPEHPNRLKIEHNIRRLTEEK
jgi:Tfp pilus assembly protein PilF